MNQDATVAVEDRDQHFGVATALRVPTLHKNSAVVVRVVTVVKLEDLFGHEFTRKNAIE
jgi:hypothetical protein